ncbi:hypothetical protein AURDEDRAFT_163717 [Auricularia subglabra TFB-10046 SS5]|nr:hypothetical protein AURDEDRAFT_163717 [Auricularia subglabra TFB-10046 SS5]
MDQVPAELVVKFLEYLPERDLRNSANVCHLFYKAAQDAGCSIRRTINFTSVEENEHALATFDAVVQHAMGKPPSYRPGVALRLVVNCSETERDTFKPSIKLILKALRASLPLLVELRAFVPTCFTTALYGSLCSAPAPRLRILTLGPRRDLDSSVISPPANLFKHTAPRLRTLNLALPTFEAGREPVTAFQHVVTANLRLYRTGRPIRISRFLPRLRSLAINLLGNMPQAGTQPVIDLSGVNLQHLALADSAGSECAITGTDNIPFVEHETQLAPAEWLWPTTDTSSSPMGACISHTAPRAISVSLADESRTRISCCSNSLLQVPALARLEKRLTTVILGNTLVNPFFGINAALSALLELHIDFTDSYHLCDLRLQSVQLTCPALRSVTLFTLGKPLELRSDRVAIIGRMLKQEERPCDERAVLKLLKINFVRPTPRKQLDIVFPIIQYGQTMDSKMLRLADSSASRVEKTCWMPR